MAPTVLIPTKPEAPARADDVAGGKGGGAGGRGFGGDRGDDGRTGAVPARAYRTGMWMALAAIVMLFAAFTSAMVVRRGVSNDWVATALPRILWLNTVVLMASSATLELSRRSLAGATPQRFTHWLYATLALGTAFVAGQLAAWRELAGRGVYLATNPSSSFFYLLTAAHGVHLLGGIVALVYLVYRARSIARFTHGHTAVEVTAMYWHFMDGLWVYVLLLLWMRL
jgi:cytochrome c oxidase subunit 3